MKGLTLRAALLAVAAAVAVPEVVASGDVLRFGHRAWQKRVLELGLDPTEVVFPFSVSPEMAAWAQRSLAGAAGGDADDRLLQLQSALLADGGFDFAYDEARTLGAEDAFVARRGNCMSFTALFVALSRSVGIPTFLVSVRREPAVARAEDLVVINRHVVAGYRSGGRLFTFDFSLASEVPFASRQVVDDVRASAMVHTNLGGAALREDRLEEAKRHLEIATILAPAWSAGWVNLGVTLAHLGDVEGAFAAYREALQADPGNSSALNNMSVLYREIGRELEARIALEAAARTTDSPFTLIATADAEMLAGNERDAARYLKRARRWYPKEPEVHDALARLARRLGRQERAARHAAEAERLRTAGHGGW